MSIREILKGIDKTEYECEHGWWETSQGAEFGKRKLEELLSEFNKNKDIDEDIENYKGVKAGIRDVFERLGNPGETFNHNCVVNNQ